MVVWRYILIYRTMTTITITDKGLERWLKNHSEESGKSLDETTEAVLKLFRATQEEDLSGWDKDDLRAEIQKGLNSGEATPWDKEEFLEYANTRFKARNG